MSTIHWTITGWFDGGAMGREPKGESEREMCVVRASVVFIGKRIACMKEQKIGSTIEVVYGY